MNFDDTNKVLLIFLIPMGEMLKPLILKLIYIKK